MTSQPGGLSNEPATLVELLSRGVRRHPDRVAYVFLGDGDNETARLSWGELGRRARAVANLLANQRMMRQTFGTGEESRTPDLPPASPRPLGLRPR